MKPDHQPNSGMKGIFRSGAWASAAMVGLIILQIACYFVWPPPATVSGFFDLFQQNPFLGLISLDFLYLINNTVLILIYLALFQSHRQAAPSAAWIALVFGLIGIAVYYASNPCFEMLSLSQLAAVSTSATDTAALRAAAEVLLATYKGTAFNSYYILNAVALLVFAASLWKTGIFGKLCPGFGLVSGVLMIIPSTAGTIGLIFSFLSLIPWIAFLVVLIPQFKRLGS